MRSHTDEEPLATACLEVGARRIVVALVVPNRMLVEPADGGEPVGYLCLLVSLTPMDFSAECGHAGEDFRVLAVGGDDNRGIRYVAMVAPEGTTRVAATTTYGLGASSRPLNGLAFLWWATGGGEPLEIIAQTPDGDVALLNRS